MNSRLLPPALLLMGPTASGKSELALKVARNFNCEIISVDSVLVYRGMDIGTAKPSVEQRAGIPHHLIDILDPQQTFSTARFRDEALSLMQMITEKGKIPLLTGGTMLYFHSLVNGLDSLPGANIEIRKQLDSLAAERGWDYLHDRLKTIDPDSAARIHPNDPQRIQRALEVYEISKRTLTEHFAAAQRDVLPYQLLKLVIAPENRVTLHDKIALRFNAMLEQGLLEEVEELYSRGDLSEQKPSIRAVGYRQVWQYLAGELDYEMMIEKAIVATRQLAKRQFTWLRKVEGACWYESEQQKLVELVTLEIDKFLTLKK